VCGFFGDVKRWVLLAVAVVAACHQVVPADPPVASAVSAHKPAADRMCPTVIEKMPQQLFDGLVLLRVPKGIELVEHSASRAIFRYPSGCVSAVGYIEVVETDDSAVAHPARAGESLSPYMQDARARLEKSGLPADLLGTAVVRGPISLVWEFSFKDTDGNLVRALISIQRREQRVFSSTYWGSDDGWDVFSEVLHESAGSLLILPPSDRDGR